MENVQQELMNLNIFQLIGEILAVDYWWSPQRAIEK
jgi:hypothetical protein